MSRRATTTAVDALVARVDGLRRFVELAGSDLPTERLDPARTVVARAGERLDLSRAHTVVALAGATGSGKSSLFNALAGADLSPVGVRRPTTADAHACVWGGDEQAQALLSWLGVGRRFACSDDDRLAGLVLVDLPDFDSVRREHRVEAERLLALGDLIVWVLDPQKYADRVLHRQFLAEFGHHRDITVVALNQADRLTDVERRSCLADLVRLLDEDGLGGVPVLATSTVGPPGFDQLRTVLHRAVATRVALLQRLAADVSAAAADLRPLVAEPGPAGGMSQRTLATDLYQALAVAAGVPLVVQATQQSYVYRAVRHTGWPVTRWVRRFRTDPLRRLRLGGPPAALAPPDATTTGLAPVTAASSIGPARPASQAAVSLALREVADQAGGALPDPWPVAMLAAARSRAADIPDALDLAVARTDFGLARPPRWWRLVGLVQWVLLAAVGAGLLGLGLRYVLFALALPAPPAPTVGRLPLFTLLFIGGLIGGLLVAAITRPIARAAARRRGRRVNAQLTASVRQVGDDLVLAPVAAVAQRYDEARRALAAAAD